MFQTYQSTVMKLPQDFHDHHTIMHSIFDLNYSKLTNQCPSPFTLHVPHLVFNIA